MADVKSWSLGSVVVSAVSVAVVLLRRSQGATLGAGPVSSTTAMFFIKLAFSAILTLAALYVVLAQRNGKPRYDPDTRKWAFSALSLVSGVWIGTATA
jgi:hypothetical protein